MYVYFFPVYFLLFLSCFIVFIFICLLYLPISLFLPLRICSSFLYLFLYLAVIFSLCFFLTYSLLSLVFVFFLFTYIHLFPSALLSLFFLFRYSCVCQLTQATEQCITPVKSLSHAHFHRLSYLTLYLIG